MRYQLPRPAIKAYEVGFLHAGGGIPCRPHPTPATTQLVTSTFNVRTSTQVRNLTLRHTKASWHKWLHVYAPCSADTHPVLYFSAVLVRSLFVTGVKCSSASVYVWVCPHNRTKKAETTITKLATGIVHHESPSPIAIHLILSQTVNVSGSQSAKTYLSWRRSSGQCEFALDYRVPTVCFVTMNYKRLKLRRKKTSEMIEYSFLAWT